MQTKHTYRMFPLSFAITGQGIAYLLAIILLSISVLRSSNNLLILILAILISAFVISSIISRNSLKQVSISLRIPKNVFAGDRVPVRISARNIKSVFPSLSVCVETLDRDGPSFLPEFFNRRRNRKASKQDDTRGRFHPFAYFPLLRPGERLSELTVYSFPRRGYYALENFRVSTRFPFGLFRHAERIDVHGAVLVFPRIYDISEYCNRLPFLPGMLEGTRKGYGESLFSIRPYMEGENARVIDWKATAKTGELMSREFLQEEERKFCLILDTLSPQKASENNREAFEKAVSLAASIAAHLSGRGASVEFLTPFAHIRHGTGEEHLYRVLSLLATVEYTHISRHQKRLNRADTYFPGIQNHHELNRIFTAGSYKIILTSRGWDDFPLSVRQPFQKIFFNEL